MLKGKQGRFRQNLLGKRVDYSGRSVIVVGPELKTLSVRPAEGNGDRAVPAVRHEKARRRRSGQQHQVRQEDDRQGRAARSGTLSKTVIKDHPVMLNRAPTLHRLGIQAFEPVLVEGRALKLHPLVLHRVQRRLRRRPDGNSRAAVGGGAGRSAYADALGKQPSASAGRQARHGRRRRI